MSRTVLLLLQALVAVVLIAAWHCRCHGPDR